jgi:hypothetical protein
LNVESIVGGGLALMVEAKAIRHDSQGAFLWKVTNRRVGEAPKDASRVLDVTKVRVTQGDLIVPFLGNWNFVPIVVEDVATLDPEHDLVAGEILVDHGDADSWDGDQILLDRSDWLLRPGDVVRVDLPDGEADSGYYVPVKAIRRESGRDSVLIVDEPQPGRCIARRVDVELTDASCSNRRGEVLQRIEAVGGSGLDDGARLIVEGVHYLVDGEAVAIVDRAEGIQ